MKSNLDEQALVELIRIRGQNEGFIKYLQAKLVTYQQLLVTAADENTVRVFQGRAQELTDLLRDIQQSPQTLEKMRRA